MSHVNARLIVHGRRLIVDRVAAGRPGAHVAAELGVSRHRLPVGQTVPAEVAAGLPDRSSRPRSTPTRTSTDREQGDCPRFC
ncbi:MAG: family transposase [Arthrobacter sp.]|nr:family transposase [Arthrobacter sp.]